MCLFSPLTDKILSYIQTTEGIIILTQQHSIKKLQIRHWLSMKILLLKPEAKEIAHSLLLMHQDLNTLRIIVLPSKRILVLCSQDCGQHWGTRDREIPKIHYRDIVASLGAPDNEWALFLRCKLCFWGWHWGCPLSSTYMHICPSKDMHGMPTNPHTLNRHSTKQS